MVDVKKGMSFKELGQLKHSSNAKSTAPNKVAAKNKRQCQFL